MALCTVEAGKSLQDGIDEVREAVDFCRYYAQQARLKLGREELKGPTGERNELFHEGRGVFVCVSPWNFPLAIYLGQSAALVAGNTVRAAGRADQPDRRPCAGADVRSRPAEGGNLPAAPPWAAFCRDPRVVGVCFTGSTDTARIINRQLAEKEGAIATLIAETGGQNAMIVDSTALPEQVIMTRSVRPSPVPASVARRCACFTCSVISPTALSNCSGLPWPSCGWGRPICVRTTSAR